MEPRPPPSQPMRVLQVEKSKEDVISELIAKFKKEPQANAVLLEDKLRATTRKMLVESRNKLFGDYPIEMRVNRIFVLGSSLALEFKQHLEYSSYILKYSGLRRCAILENIVCEHVGENPLLLVIVERNHHNHFLEDFDFVKKLRRRYRRVVHMCNNEGLDWTIATRSLCVKTYL